MYSFERQREKESKKQTNKTKEPVCAGLLVCWFAPYLPSMAGVGAG